MYLVQHRTQLSKFFAVTLFVLVVISAHSWSDTSIVDTAMEFVGLALIIAGSFGRIWSYLYICGRKTDELVIIGPYSITRNPLYLFSLIAAVGVGLASENILVLGLIVLVFGLVYPIVIRSEEKELVLRHGKAFQEYAHTVPRFIPKTFVIQQPEHYKVHVHLFGRVFFDAMWFVWLFILMEVIEKLHEAKVIPVLFTVP